MIPIRSHLHRPPLQKKGDSRRPLQFEISRFEMQDSSDFQFSSCPTDGEKSQLPDSLIPLQFHRLFPGISPALKRPHAGDSVISQKQRRTGAGRFVWSGAEQDDFLIARDFGMTCRQFFGRNSERARK